MCNYIVSFCLAGELVLVLGGQVLILVLVLKDSLRTYFKSLSLFWSLGGQVLVLVLGGQVLDLVLVLGVRSLSLPWSLGVRSLLTSLVQTLPSRTSCNRRSIPTLYLGAGDPCRRYPGQCLAALGGQTRTRRSENN